jgi:hypothetical protein
MEFKFGRGFYSQHFPSGLDGSGNVVDGVILKRVRELVEPAEFLGWAWLARSENENGILALALGFKGIEGSANLLLALTGHCEGPEEVRDGNPFELQCRYFNSLILL